MLGLPSDEILVGCVGKLRPEKGHRYVIEAVASLVPKFPRLRLVLVGDGPERGNLEHQARNQGVASHIFFFGNRQDIPELLEAFDLFVLGSFYEGMSNAILEAMAASLPVITTNIPENREIVQSGVNGFLVPPRDSSAIAQALRKLILDPNRARAFGQASRNRIEQDFSSSVTLRKLHELYHQLLVHDPI